MIDWTLSKDHNKNIKSIFSFEKTNIRNILVINRFFFSFGIQSKKKNII